MGINRAIMRMVFVTLIFVIIMPVVVMPVVVMAVVVMPVVVMIIVTLVIMAVIIVIIVVMRLKTRIFANGQEIRLRHRQKRHLFTRPRKISNRPRQGG
jgi:predicted membrane metal-binding protein